MVPSTSGMSHFSGRNGLALLADPSDAGVLYVLGGQDQYQAALGDVWRTMDGGTSWRSQTPGANEAFPARASHVALLNPDGSAMFILGGADVSGMELNDVWVSADEGANWSRRASFGGARRNFGAVFDASGELVVFGGTPFTPAVSSAMCLA